MRNIYCPWCTDTMVMKDGHLYCQKGNVGLSRRVESEILEALESIEPHTKVGGATSDISYHCPNCGSDLKYTGSPIMLRCKECGFSLKPGAGHMLTEYHTHENWPTK